jgi:hypothetical protein
MTPRDSGSLDVVLELAAREATNAGYSVITPAHLLMGLSKLCEMGDPGSTNEGAAPLRREFEQLGIESRAFRRGLRAIVGNGGTRAQKGVLHRSASCRALFSAAGNLAAQAGARLEPVHLLRAAFLGFREIDAVSGDQTPGQGRADAEVPTEL